MLTAVVMDAHNTFEQPESVRPADFDGACVSQGVLRVAVPAKSVVVLSEVTK